MTTLTDDAATTRKAVYARAAELAPRRQWSADELARHRTAALQDLVAFVSEHSPYYRDALRPAGRRGYVELEHLPTLPKSTLMDEFDRIVTDPCLRLADLEQHLAGPDPGSAFKGRYRVFASSGSSGFRGVFVHSEDEFATWIAAHLPVLTRLGIGPETRLAPIGAPSPFHLSKQLFAAFTDGRRGVPNLTVLTPLPEVRRELERFRPEALIGYASAISALAQEQLDGRLEIAPRIAVTGAELLTHEMDARIEAAWGIRASQVYATTEVPIIAASVPDQDGLLVLADLVWIEIVDEHYHRVPLGTPGYKVLLTNLVNRAQPLIRYELTDSVTLGSIDVIASIDGRSDDILRLPGKGGSDVVVHPLDLRTPFTRLPDVSLYQITYDGREIRVRIVRRPDATKETEERVRWALQTTLDAAGATTRVHVDAVSEIEREGHAAKLKLVKILHEPSRK